MIDPAPVELRPFAETDLHAIYEISLLTGDGGGDATRLYTNPKLIGEIYSAPYAILEPGLAFVAEDDLGVAGYIVGAADTRAFEARLERDWWPALRSTHAAPCGTDVETWNADELRAYQIHHPRPAADSIVVAFPAHLHMNLHPRLQRRGVGGRLLDRWLGVARNLGVSGVHLGVNAANDRALRYWTTQGFTRIERPSTPRSAIWFGMTL